MIDPSQRRIIHIYQLRTSFLFAWFTRTLLKGAKEKLQIEDLPHIPFEIESKNCVLEFLNSARLSTIKREDDDWLDKYTFNQSHDSKKGQVNIWPLLLSILFCHGWTFFKIMILKLVICALSFVGPILLGKIVAYLEGGVTHSNLDHGFILVAALSGTTLLSSILNANANTRYLEIKLKLQASLAIIVYSRALSLPAIAWKDLEFSDAQINNFIQVDVDQISSFMQTINDLWVLPLQILVAFILLYAQIKVAFVAGILLMILMIPFNSYIANLIGKNTERLMKEKDLRMKIMIESISNVISCKMFGLENIILNIANSYREKEFKYLSRRKYLDAICVFLWASTPVLVPFLTFVVAVTVTKQELKASNVITTIALLNMLIFPMNALPWIVNGFMEAKVSLKRIGKLLNSSNNDSLNIKQVLIDEINEGSEKKRPAFLMDDYPYKPENSKDPLIRPFNEEFNDGRKSSSKKRRASLPQERVLGDISFTIRKNSFSWISHPSSPESGSSKKLSFWSFSKKKPEHDSTNNLVGDLFSVRLKEDVFCRYGEMKAFVGSTGCGKTTLLLGILNEVRKTLQYSNEDYHHSFSFSSVTSQEAIQLQYAGDNPLMVGRAPSTSSMNEGHLALIQSSSKGKISYCAQVPAVFSGTIKSNIIMGNEFEINRYQRILEGCCLIPDCNAWAQGDTTEVGQQGSQLSGGQRLRLGIARAVYANSDVIILDDPFSALDENTSTSIRDFLFQFIMIQEKRTIIIATHSLHLLNNPMVTEIIVLKQGEEVERGTYSNLATSSSSYFHSLIDEQESKLSKLQDSVDEYDAEEHKKLITNEEKKIQSLMKQDEEQLALEKSKTGMIESKVYWSYFQASGLWMTFFTILFTLLMQTSNISMSFWLGYWSTHQGNYTDLQFIQISSAIVICNVFFTFFRSILFAKAGLNAAYLLYNRLANSVMSTDIHFFETTSIGQIVNRFGKDTNTVDDDLPFIMNILLAQTFLLLGSCFLMCFNDPMIIVLLIFVFILYYRIQKFYRLTSRELRRLDAIYKSPIYNIFTDCMNGSIELRSLGEKNIQFYLYKLQKYLNDSLRVSFANTIASSWLNTRMQLLGSLITTVLALSILANGYYHLLPLTPGLAGLSLIYSFSIVNNLNGFINSMTETEQEMISVERVLEYSALLSEFNEDSETDLYSRRNNHQDPSSDPPYHSSGFCGCCGKKKSKYELLNHEEDGAAGDNEEEDRLKDSLLDQAEIGQSSSVIAIKRQESYWNYISFIIKERCFFMNDGIHFHNVFMKYPSANEDSLKEITLSVPKGSRILLMGRTGSGKSSLLRLLLRMNDYYSGSITFNQGIELKAISKQLLRKTITILPQKPLLLTGTLKMNVDPLNLFSDEEIMIALYESSFLTTLRSISKEVTVEQRGPSSFSAGMNSGQVRTTSTEKTIDWSMGVDKTIHDVLEYPITEGGNNLSWGQKQLLCLARALLRKSDLILIDEVSASLDNETKLLVFSALERHVTRMPSTILFIISHHLEGLDNLCNHVLRLDNGRIAEYSTLKKSSSSSSSNSNHNNLGTSNPIRAQAMAQQTRKLSGSQESSSGPALYQLEAAGKKQKKKEKQKKSHSET